jgi:hypothetical protein
MLRGLYSGLCRYCSILRKLTWSWARKVKFMGITINCTRDRR